MNSGHFRPAQVRLERKQKRQKAQKRVKSSFLLFLPFLSFLLPSSQHANYLFAYFKNNGEDGLHLAYSRDGLKWKVLNDDRSYLAPAVGSQKLMRDPCVIQGPDGVFHMVWTTGWRGQDIGVAH